MDTCHESDVVLLVLRISWTRVEFYIRAEFKIAYACYSRFVDRAELCEDMYWSFYFRRIAQLIHRNI